MISPSVFKAYLNTSNLKTQINYNLVPRSLIYLVTESNSNSANHYYIGIDKQYPNTFRPPITALNQTY